MDLGLEGSVVLVTGGSAGIGRAVVARLLAEGALVATCARDGERLRAAYPDADPDRLLLEVCDVTDARAVADLVDRVVARFSRLDGVVANAGTGGLGDVLDVGADMYDDQFTLKMHPVLLMLPAALPHLRRSPHPAVVVMNAVTAHAPDREMAAVSVARAALATLVVMLADRLAAEGVRINTVNLGALVTDRQRDRHAAEAPDRDFDEWCAEEAARRRIPWGRMGQPHEVAPMTALLLSPLSSYVTGTAVDVAGGMDARA